MTEIIDIEIQLGEIKTHIIEMSQSLESDKDSYVRVISEFMQVHGVSAIDVSLLKTKVRDLLDGVTTIWHFMRMVRDALSESPGYLKTKQ